MRYLIIILLITIGLIDGSFFFIFLSKGTLLTPLIGHFIFTVLIYLLINGFLKKNQGVPNYLVLFMPGLGGILVGLIHFGLLYFRRNSEILVSYEQYVNYQRFFDIQKNHDYEREIRTISFIDQMNLLDVKSKKQLILESTSETDNHKIKVFKRGLLDSDEEVQHYSAVTLNMLENEYTRIINKVREEFNETKDTDSLKRLMKAYQSYLESGLLSEDTYKLFNREYIDVLTKFIEKRRETPKLLNQLVKAYINDGEFVKANAFNRRVLEKFPADTEAILHKLQIAFEEKKYEQICEEIEDLKNRYQILPFELEKSLDFWKLKGVLK